MRTKRKSKMDGSIQGSGPNQTLTPGEQNEFLNLFTFDDSTDSSVDSNYRKFDIFQFRLSPETETPEIPNVFVKINKSFLSFRINKLKNPGIEQYLGQPLSVNDGNYVGLYEDIIKYIPSPETDGKRRSKAKRRSKSKRRSKGKRRSKSKRRSKVKRRSKAKRSC